MMRAMKYLDNARLNIAGGTPEQIGGLTLLAQEMDVKDKVNFLGFIDPKNALIRLLSTISVYSRLR